MLLVALPRELKARGHEVALAMPYYREVRDRRKLKVRPLSVSIEIPLGDQRLRRICSRTGLRKVCKCSMFVAINCLIDQAFTRNAANPMPTTPRASFSSAKSPVEVARRMTPRPEITALSRLDRSAGAGNGA